MHDRVADSQVSPARRVGAVAIKPSGRRVPKAGIFGISELIDTAGPMGRSVWEVAALLDTLVTDSHESFLSVIEHSLGDSPKFGVPPSHFFMESLRPQDKGYKYTRDAKEEAETLFTKVVEGLNDVRTVDLPAVSRITKWKTLENVHESKGPMERILMTQFVQGFDLFVSEYLTGGDNKTLADVVRWNDAHRVSFNCSWKPLIILRARAWLALSVLERRPMPARCSRDACSLAEWKTSPIRMPLAWLTITGMTSTPFSRPMVWTS